MTYDLPIRVNAGKKKGKPYVFPLNLNAYRNEHYQILNRAKKNYDYLIRATIPFQIIYKKPIKITYTLYKGDKRKCDIANICSIVDKFTCDSMQKLGIIQNDDYDTVKSVQFKWGGIDKNFERVEMEIEDA